MKITRVAVVLNSSAGHGAALEQQALAVRLFEAVGIEARIWLGRRGDDFKAMAERALGASCDALVAAGGDGTVSTVAGVAVAHAQPLGVLPLGTFNHFARDAGLRLAPEAAVADIAGGRIVLTDVAEVNRRIFVNNSSFGLYSDLVPRAEVHRRHGYPWLLARLRAALSLALHYKVHHIRVTADGRRFDYRTPFVFVGNNRYQRRGWSLGNRLSLTGGKLFLCVARCSTGLDLLKIGLGALTRRLDTVHGLETMEVSRLRLNRHRRHRRTLVAIDGEMVDLVFPLDYRIRPKSLRLLG